MAAFLRPWMQGPFELLLHAEEHYIQGNDYDRRIALIGFDEAIEVSITVYLSLHPIHRNGREYKREDIYKWSSNYHSKLKFYYAEVKERGLSVRVPIEDVIWFHDHRNEQYHGGTKGIPDGDSLKGIRTAAIWIFSTLFEVDQVEILLENELKARKGHTPERKEEIDKALDEHFGLVEVGGNKYYTSELLYATDPNAYFELGNQLLEKTANDEND